MEYLERPSGGWALAIIEDAERILERQLSPIEITFIASRGSFIALEMIHDTVKGSSPEELVAYLNSETTPPSAS